MFLHSEGSREDQCPHAAPLAIQAETLYTSEGTIERASGEESQVAGRDEQRGPVNTTALQQVPILHTAQPNQAAAHQGQSLLTVSRQPLQGRFSYQLHAQNPLDT